MLLAGDERLNSQQGNNNSYCQNNALSWLDWTLDESRADMLRFVQHMIALRKRHPALMRRRFLSGNPSGERGLADISWYAADGGTPDWHDDQAQVLIFTLAAVAPAEADLHVILNMSTETLDTRLPTIPDRNWRLAVDSSRSTPDDILPPASRTPVAEQRIRVPARSVVVYESA